MHDLESIHKALSFWVTEFLNKRPKAVGYQKHAQEDNENTLDQIGPIRGCQTAEDPLDDHNSGKPWNQDVFQFKTSDFVKPQKRNSEFGDCR